MVYLGLTYLGATMSQFFDITVDRTYLVTSIVQGLLGQGASSCSPWWWLWPA